MNFENKLTKALLSESKTTIKAKHAEQYMQVVKYTQPDEDGLVDTIQTGLYIHKDNLFRLPKEYSATRWIWPKPKHTYYANSLIELELFDV